MSITSTILNICCSVTVVKLAKKEAHVKLFGVLVLCFLALQVKPVHATDSSRDNLQSSYTLFFGYGETHPGLGDTKTSVETIDVILRYDIPITGRWGSSWYRGHHSLMVELPVSFVIYPQTGPMVGLTVLGSWFFSSCDRYQPYVFGGGGAVYTDADIEGLSSRFNASWQFGAGVQFKLDSGNWLKIEYRFHHISNTGVKDPNDPLNSSKILFGLTF